MFNYSSQLLTKKVIFDIYLIVIVNTIAFLIFSKIDALEWLYNYSLDHEKYELDEVIVLFFTLSISMVFFSIRRWREAIELLKVVEIIAVKDPLTGTFNRRYFNDVLIAEIKRSKRTGDIFSLVMLDIDHFKKVNDNYGHNVGDKVICQFSEILVNLSRESDIVSRWGGRIYYPLS